MYSIQVDETLQQIVKIFYQIGVWQTDEDSNRRKIGKKLFYTLFGALFPIFFAANSILCADWNESIFSVQLSAQTAVLYVKLLYVLFKRQEILAFLYDQAILHCIENRAEFEQANKKIEKFRKFVRPYNLAMYISGVLLLVSKLPMFSHDKSLPFFISFSWNDSNIIYWLAFVFLTMSAVLYITINLSTCLIWYMMLNYSTEYEVLGNKLRRLGLVEVVEKKTISKAVKNQEIFRSTQRSPYADNLVVLIKAHRNLSGTIERFRSCFAKLFLTQIATSGIGICVSVYNLAFFSKENIFQTELYFATLIYGIFDIFMVLYLANEITVKSDRLSYCLFESNWIEQSESCKKYVIIMGEVLKQPQQLVILIYPMNLETFLMIINGAYSMYNILLSFQ